MFSRSQVSLNHCSPNVTDAELAQHTYEAITALPDYGARFSEARNVAVKINAGVHRLTEAHGKQVELTDPAVVEGTIRALREVTDAELLVGDAPTDGHAMELYAKLGLTERLARYPRVRLVDFNLSELVTADMTHSGAMFKNYVVPREVLEADAVVSVAKMKAHAAVGFTLSIKNLFGWLPMSVYGTPRRYLHDRLVRLPRVLADLALWTNPALCVVDGVVASAKREWGGDVMTPGVLLAGTNAVAVDATGARVMGFDPNGDYPDTPFFYRRNPVKLAAEGGLGPLAEADIEILGRDIESVRTGFEVQKYRGDTQRDVQLRRGAECVRLYQEQQDEWAHQHAGKLLAFFDGELVWEAPDIVTMQKLEWESDRDWQTAPQFVVRCLPVEEEIEDFRWYEVDAAHTSAAPV